MRAPIFFVFQLLLLFVVTLLEYWIIKKKFIKGVDMVKSAPAWLKATARVPPHTYTHTHNFSLNPTKYLVCNILAFERPLSIFATYTPHQQFVPVSSEYAWNVDCKQQQKRKTVKYVGKINKNLHFAAINSFKFEFHKTSTHT